MYMETIDNYTLDWAVIQIRGQPECTVGILWLCPSSTQCSCLLLACCLTIGNCYRCRSWRRLRPTQCFVCKAGLLAYLHTQLQVSPRRSPSRNEGIFHGSTTSVFSSLPSWPESNPQTSSVSSNSVSIITSAVAGTSSFEEVRVDGIDTLKIDQTYAHISALLGRSVFA